MFGKDSALLLNLIKIRKKIKQKIMVLLKSKQALNRLKLTLIKPKNLLKSLHITVGGNLVSSTTLQGSITEQ